MAIKSLEQRKKQKNLLFIAGAILIVAVIILYFVFWQGSKIPSQALPGDVSSAKSSEEKAKLILEEKLKKIELDFSFLTEKILPFLKSYGDLPVEKGTTGRTNPFIPY